MRPNYYPYGIQYVYLYNSDSNALFFEPVNYPVFLDQVQPNKAITLENLEETFKEQPKSKDIVEPKQEENEAKEKDALKVAGCNCQKSKCMKEYCSCFKNWRFCDETCGCKGCRNSNNRRTKPMVSMEQKSCNCKKSKCCNKYCECFVSGLKCKATCKCENCENPSDC